MGSHSQSCIYWLVIAMHFARYWLGITMQIFRSHAIAMAAVGASLRNNLETARHKNLETA
jgi:hypothetical protein